MGENPHKKRSRRVTYANLRTFSEIAVARDYRVFVMKLSGSKRVYVSDG